MKKKSYQLLLSLGYTNKVAQEIVNSSLLHSHKDESLLKNILNVYSYLKKYYTKNEIIKMTKNLPSLYSHGVENLKQKMDDMIKLGYTKKDVIEMTKKFPALYSHAIENMKQKIKDMIELGYTKKDIIKMTKNSPALYGYSIENMKKKIEDMMHLGYTKEDVIEMTKKLPALFSYSIENIKRKINFYKSINLENIVLEDTKHLMQSASLSYARYRYLTIKEIKITKDNYSKLFYSQNNFKKSFGIDNKEVRKFYPFEEYLKVQKLYERLEILNKLNPNAAKELLNNKVQKYIDSNSNIEKRINNKYSRVLKNSKV